MTIEEASRRYQIPLETLQEYERFGLCSSVKKIMGVWQYDDEDLERMSMIMTLHEVGFESQKVETYMQLLLDGSHTVEQRLEMLNARRKAALEEIHLRENQLRQLDYLRHKLQKVKQQEE